MCRWFSPSTEVIAVPMILMVPRPRTIMDVQAGTANRSLAVRHGMCFYWTNVGWWKRGVSVVESLDFAMWVFFFLIWFTVHYQKLSKYIGNCWCLIYWRLVVFGFAILVFTSNIMPRFALVFDKRLRRLRRTLIVGGLESGGLLWSHQMGGWMGLGPMESWWETTKKTQLVTSAGYIFLVK